MRTDSCRSLGWLLIFLIALVVPSQVYAQSYQQLIGSDYYLVTLPNGVREIGQLKEGSINFTEPEQAYSDLSALNKNDQKRIAALNRLLKSGQLKAPKGKLYGGVRKLLKQIGFDGRIDGKDEARIRKGIRNLKQKIKIRKRIESEMKAFLENGTLPTSVGSFLGTFNYTFTGSRGDTMYYYGVYLGVPKPKNSKKPVYYCVTYTGEADEPHVGGLFPEKMVGSFVSDPCAASSNPLLLGESCNGIFGDDYLGTTLSAGAGFGNEPSASAKEAIVAKLGSGVHFVEQSKKVTCK